MTFVKALCVLLLLYYASFGESERLENDSISKKSQEPDEKQTKVEKISPYDKKMNAYELGVKLANTVRFVTGSEQGSQFGYVFLNVQPASEKRIYLIPAFIARTLSGNKKSMAKPRTPWPQTTDTNFRVSYVNDQEPSDSNYGHSEYQLLAGGELLDMVDYVGCPSYVIVYSNIFPCIKPVNPDPKIPRCAELITEVHSRFFKICPDAPFYLLTERETGNNLPDKEKLDAIMNSGIIWIHKDMNDIGPELEKWDPSQKMPEKTEP